MKRTIFAGLIGLLGLQPAWAGIISVELYADAAAFSSATGAVSLTGPLPDIGSQGTSVTLGGATLSAADSIFVGSGWSTLLPDGRAIAISGPEDLEVSIDAGAATAFGFYFHEPTAPTRLDGCNADCMDSLFLIEFLSGGSVLDSMVFSPADDVAIFLGIILDETFDTVRFTEAIGGSDNEFFGEMFVARVPEPGVLSLLGAALVGFGVVGRKRKT